MKKYLGWDQNPGPQDQTLNGDWYTNHSYCLSTQTKAGNLGLVQPIDIIKNQKVLKHITQAEEQRIDPL